MSAASHATPPSDGVHRKAAVRVSGWGRREGRPGTRMADLQRRFSATAARARLKWVLASRGLPEIDERQCFRGRHEFGPALGRAAGPR